MFGYAYLGILAFSFVVNLGTMGVLSYRGVKKWRFLRKARKVYQEDMKK